MRSVAAALVLLTAAPALAQTGVPGNTGTVRQPGSSAPTGTVVQPRLSNPAPGGSIGGRSSSVPATTVATPTLPDNRSQASGLELHQQRR